MDSSQGVPETIFLEKDYALVSGMKWGLLWGVTELHIYSL